MKHGRTEAAGVHYGFGVTKSLHFLPKCDEMDPDMFFALFVQMPGVRGWSSNIDAAMYYYRQGPKSFFCV